MKHQDISSKLILEEKCYLLSGNYDQRIRGQHQAVRHHHREGCRGPAPYDMSKLPGCAKGKPDLNIIFIYNMPSRAIGKRPAAR